MPNPGNKACKTFSSSLGDGLVTSLLALFFFSPFSKCTNSPCDTGELGCTTSISNIQRSFSSGSSSESRTMPLQTWTGDWGGERACCLPIRTQTHRSLWDSGGSWAMAAGSDRFSLCQHWEEKEHFWPHTIQSLHMLLHHIRHHIPNEGYWVQYGDLGLFVVDDYSRFERNPLHLLYSL